MKLKYYSELDDFNKIGIVFENMFLVNSYIHIK